MEAPLAPSGLRTAGHKERATLLKDQVTGHTEMEHQGVFTVRKIGEQVLPQPPGASDRGSSESASKLRPGRPGEHFFRVGNLYILEDSAKGVALEKASLNLHIWQLRHKDLLLSSYRPGSNKENCCAQRLLSLG